MDGDAVTVVVDVTVDVAVDPPVVNVLVEVIVRVLVAVQEVGHVAGEVVVVVRPRRQEQTELAWAVLEIYVESVLGSPAMLVCVDARYAEQEGDALAEIDSTTWSARFWTLLRISHDQNGVHF